MGRKEKKLTIYIKKLKLEKKIILKGWVQNYKKYFFKVKIFVLSSKYEGLGNVLIDKITIYLVYQPIVEVGQVKY